MDEYENCLLTAPFVAQSYSRRVKVCARSKMAHDIKSAISVDEAMDLFLYQYFVTFKFSPESENERKKESYA